MCVTYLGDTNIREHNLHANVNKMHVQHTVIHITQYTAMYIMIQVNREKCRSQTCMIWGTDENFLLTDCTEMCVFWSKIIKFATKYVPHTSVQT